MLHFKAKNSCLFLFCIVVDWIGQLEEKKLSVYCFKS